MHMNIRAAAPQRPLTQRRRGDSKPGGGAHRDSGGDGILQRHHLALLLIREHHGLKPWLARGHRCWPGAGDEVLR